MYAPRVGSVEYRQSGLVDHLKPRDTVARNNELFELVAQLYEHFAGVAEHLVCVCVCVRVCMHMYVCACQILLSMHVCVHACFENIYGCV